MTDRISRRSFAARPGDANAWIKAQDRSSAAPARGSGFSARLTIDVTPELRGRIKITAFNRGLTVADMLRDLLASNFPPADGDPS